MSTGYEVTYMNEVKRDPHKARYDVATIRAILEEARFVNVAFVDEDGYPQCIPMVHAVVGDASGLTVYLHGHHRARLVRLLPPETRVCITATLLDGLVLALSAFSSSVNHRSAVVHGEVAEWDEDSTEAYAEKMEAARQIVEAVMPGRWDDCRQPTRAEMTTTGFIKVKVLSASAKYRDGPPGEEKRDEDDVELKKRVWSGVVPVNAALGKPVPAQTCDIPVPKYIADQINHAGPLSG